MRTLAALLLCFLAIGADAQSGTNVDGAQAYRVVVNAANSETSADRAELARLFLKQDTKWKSGVAVVVVDQDVTSATRAAFSRAVLGREVLAIRRYWQQEIFSGRNAPPTERGSDAEVLAFVAANPDAIGYVSARATLGAGVKALHVN